TCRPGCGWWRCTGAPRGAAARGGAARRRHNPRPRSPRPASDRPRRRRRERLTQRGDQSRRVAQGVVGRQYQLGGDVITAHLGGRGGAGEAGDRTMKLVREELLRTPAADRVGGGDDVRGGEAHEPVVEQDVLDPVLAEDAVAQLGDDHLGPCGTLLYQAVE